MLKQTGNSRGWVRVPSPEPEDHPAPPVVVSRIGPARPGAAAAKPGAAAEKRRPVRWDWPSAKPRRVLVDGVAYPSVRDAAAEIGCTESAIYMADRQGRRFVNGRAVAIEREE